MEKIKTFLDYSFRVFDIATMKGIYLLLFLGAAAYLMLLEDRRRGKAVYKLLLTCIIALALLVSPFLGAFAGKQVDTRVLRLYWATPFEFVVLYCVVDILYRCEKTKKKAAFLCVVLAGLVALSRQDNLTYPKVEQKWPWVRAENLYKVPQPVYELCNRIEEEENWQGCRAAFPFEYAYMVRQYDASIDMPYGYYVETPTIPIFVALTAEEIDLDAVGRGAIAENLEYIVLDQNKVVSGSLEEYHDGKLDTVEGDGTVYAIYQRVK